MSTYSEDVKSVFHYGKNNVAKFISFILTWIVIPILLILIFMGDSQAFNLFVFIVVIQYVIVSFSIIMLVVTLYAIQNESLDNKSMEKLRKSSNKYDSLPRKTKRFLHQMIAVIISFTLAYLGYIFFAYTYLFFMVFMTYIIYKILDRIMEEVKKIKAKND